MSEKDDGGIEWLGELLKDVQLEQFFSRLRDDLQVGNISFIGWRKRQVQKLLLLCLLQVTRLQHFDHVEPSDLEKIGMGKPAVRRLLEAVKKRRRKNILTKLIPASGKTHGTSSRKSSSTESAGGGLSLTCLIHEKDVA